MRTALTGVGSFTPLSLLRACARVLPTRRTLRRGGVPSYPPTYACARVRARELGDTQKQPPPRPGPNPTNTSTGVGGAVVAPFYYACACAGGERHAPLAPHYRAGASAAYWAGRRQGLQASATDRRSQANARTECPNLTVPPALCTRPVRPCDPRLRERRDRRERRRPHGRSTIRGPRATPPSALVRPELVARSHGPGGEGARVLRGGRRGSRLRIQVEDDRRRAPAPSLATSSDESRGEQPADFRISAAAPATTRRACPTLEHFARGRMYPSSRDLLLGE